MVIGLALDFAGLNAVKMLFWSAVVNGVRAAAGCLGCDAEQRSHSDGRPDKLAYML
jgi:hypothetical protein